MLQILCPAEQKQAIVNWIIAEDTRLFHDVEREFGGPKDGHAGIFDIEENVNGMTIDCGEDEFYFRGHSMPAEVEGFVRALKKKFPAVGMEGTLYVSDQNGDVEYEIRKKAGSGRLYITNINDEDEDDE